MTSEIDKEGPFWRKKFTNEVTIVVGGEHKILWVPGKNQLYAGGAVAKEMASFIWYFILDSSRQGEIAVTPEGPFLPATVENLYTVVWAFSVIYGDQGIEYLGKVPTLKDMGLLEESD